MRERRFRSLLFMAGTSLLVAASPHAVAVAAAAGTSGAGAFVATLTLSAFPCAGAFCAGTLTGSFSGSMSGVDPASCPIPPPVPTPPSCHYYTVIWPDPTAPPPTANLSGSFTYLESCPIGQSGDAGGTYTVTGGYVDDNGSIAHDGTMTGGLSYSREGLVFTMTLSVTSVSGDGHILGTQQVPIGSGAGAFAPEVVATCTTISGNVTAKVVGASVVPE
jgi:hypothetical protein